MKRKSSFGGASRVIRVVGGGSICRGWRDERKKFEAVKSIKQKVHFSVLSSHKLKTFFVPFFSLYILNSFASSAWVPSVPKAFCVTNSFHCSLLKMQQTKTTLLSIGNGSRGFLFFADFLFHFIDFVYYQFFRFSLHGSRTVFISLVPILKIGTFGSRSLVFESSFWLWWPLNVSHSRSFALPWLAKAAKTILIFRPQVGDENWKNRKKILPFFGNSTFQGIEISLCFNETDSNQGRRHEDDTWVLKREFFLLFNTCAGEDQNIRSDNWVERMKLVISNSTMIMNGITFELTYC